MKKLFTLSCLLGLILGIQAQSTRRNLIPADGFLRSQTFFEKHFMKQQPQDATYKLTARISSDFYEAKRFFYNNQNQIVAIKDSVGNDDLVIDSIFYDGNGRVIEISGHQFLNHTTWKHVYKLLYEYDAEGRMTHRTNYNTLGTDTFNLGGVYDYTYDAQNRLISHELYLGPTHDLCETGTYVYDANGRHILDIFMAGFGVLDSSMKITYTYDENNHLIEQSSFYYNGTGWEKDDYELFTYDDAGNCIIHEVLDSKGTVTDKRLYEYQLEVPASDVFMPYDIPDTEIPEAFDDANMRVLEKWYTVNEDYILIYICDYTYIYNGSQVSVPEMPQPKMGIYPNPTNGPVTVSGDSFACDALWVMDLSGRVLQELSNVGNQVVLNLSDYPAGIYLVKMFDKQGGTVVRKLVKK